MPGSVRKLIIVAAVDGLILQPNGNPHRNGNYGPSPIQIEYQTLKISSLTQLPAELSEKKSASLEAHGIVGMAFPGPFPASSVTSLCQQRSFRDPLGMLTWHLSL